MACGLGIPFFVTALGTAPSWVTTLRMVRLLNAPPAGSAGWQETLAQQQCVETVEEPIDLLDNR